ncbi:DNA helicase [Tanacetum coccineum]
MKGKRKCDNVNSKRSIPYDARAYGDWDGNFDSVTKRQQYTRQWMQNPTASYDDNIFFDGFGGVGGPIALDFESSGVCQPSMNEDSGDFFSSYKWPQFLPDGRYDWLFRQSGSVETQGESSAAAASKRMPYCDMGLLPYGQANAFEVVSESHTRAQDSSFVSSYKKGPLVLDFESSSVHMSSTDGSTHVSSGLSQHTRADAILPYSQADVLETGSDNHTTVHNSSFVSGHNTGQVVLDFASSVVLIPSTDGRVHVCSSLQSSVFSSHDKAKDLNSHQTATVATQGNSDTYFVTHEKRRSGIRKRYGRRHAASRRVFGQLAITEDIGSSNSSSRGVSSLYMDIGGKVILEDEREPPEYIKELFGDRNFLEHIRAYNQIGTQSAGLNEQTVEGLMRLLDECNELVRLFRTARDKCNGQQIPDFKIRLYSVVSAREYDLPTSQTLGAIVFENGQNTETDYDVIIESKHGFPQRINKLHSSYMALQFPLIFVYGQPGFHIEMKLRMPGEAKRLSMNMFYMYQLHERQHQADIRKDYLSGIYDAISRGDREGYEIGSRVILPTSFTGGPRYMYSHYLDALAICRVLGNPQYFITFTSNVNWPEIKRHMEQYPGLLPGDRSDIVVRVFKQKVHDFCKYLSATQLFGTVTGYKIQDAKDVDRYISAELPDPKTDPEGYRVVSEMMVHGPCGPADPTASCMKENLCSKKFPKKLNNETYFDNNDYVYYRRRDTGVEVTRRGMDLDNSHVVPYNRQLCLAFHAHINVEYYGWSMLIKYLFKYISKGTDKTVAQIIRPVGLSEEHLERREEHIDEIQNFVDGRFICPHEACWRILKFEIHSRYPAVQILYVHLENKQLVTFRDRQPLEFIANNDGKKIVGNSLLRDDITELP